MILASTSFLTLTVVKDSRTRPHTYGIWRRAGPRMTGFSSILSWRELPSPTPAGPFDFDASGSSSKAIKLLIS